MARNNKKKRSLKINKKKVQDAAKDRSKGGGNSYLALPTGAEAFKVSGKKHVLDFLLYEVKDENNPLVKDGKIDQGDLWYERTFFTHRGIGPENKTVVCPAKVSGLPCPICEEVARMNGDSEADEDELKSLLPKKRQLFNVIDLEDKEKGVQVFDYSYHLLGKKLDAEINDEDDGDDNADFANLEDGKTLKLRFSEEKFGKHTYYEVDGIKFVDRKKDYEEDILDDVHDLDSLLILESYETLQALLEGTSAPEDDEDEPKSKKKDKEEEEDNIPMGGEDEDEDGGKNEEEENEIPDGCVECKACEGSGKNSRGKECVPCDGDGYVKASKKKKDDDDDEPDKKSKKKKDEEDDDDEDW